MFYWRKPANTNILQLPLASGGSFSLNTPRRIVAYLDGLYPDGHLRQARVNALLPVFLGGYSERGRFAGCARFLAGH